MNKLLIIVPCYNEEEVIHYTADTLKNVLDNLTEKEKISPESRILFVNDGSKDRTWEHIVNISKSNKYVLGLNLASNVGHQNALIAGIEFASREYDINVSIDADLQDDVNVIEDMIDKYKNGADIVYGVRNDRKSDSAFKRLTAQGFYKVMSFLGVNTVYNHADFRLMSRRASRALLEYPERNLFLRGLAVKLGFNTDSVYYSRSARTAGESKYNLKKMISFAWDGITSFSTKPIDLITGLGTFMCICAIISEVIFVATDFCNLNLATIINVIVLCTGIQLFAIGIVGQYVGKTYFESKQRPRYHIEDTLDHNENKEQ